MARRKPFDMRALEKLEPKLKRFDYRDEWTPGLVLTVTPGGAKSFYWVGRIGSRVERVRLGTLGEFETIADVRALAAGHTLKKAQGGNPADERRAIRRETTFGELWTMFLERWAKPRKRSWKTDEKRYNCHLKTWARLPLGEIRRADAVKLLEKIAATSGPGAANRTRALAHKMFRWAQGQGFEVENPFAGTPRNAEKQKARYLQPDELRRFWRALQEDRDRHTRDFAALLLLTGVRGGSLAAARWGDISLTDRVWEIPAEAMKAGKPLSLPLAPRAVSILRERLELTRPGERYVFPSRLSSREHLDGMPREGWARVLKAAGIENLTRHDLRRTHATYGLQAGIPIEVLGKALGHTPIGGVTSIYARADLALVRLAVEKTVTVLLQIAESSEEDGKVLQFPRPAWAGVE